MPRFIVVCALFVGIAATAAAGVDQLEHRLIPDGDIFRNFDDVGVTYEACNTTDEVIVHEWEGGPAPPWTLMVVDGSGEEIATYSDGLAYPLVYGFWRMEWQPGECEPRLDVSWHQRMYDSFGPDAYRTYGPQAPEGVYRFQVPWYSHDGEPPAIVIESSVFEILPGPLVKPGQDR